MIKKNRKLLIILLLLGVIFYFFRRGQKVKAEMDRRREETGAYTPEAVTRQLEKEIEQLRGEI